MKPYLTSLKAGNRGLSRSYSVATSRVHDAITDLYDGLHDSDGVPIHDVEEVYEMIRSVRQLINIEFDMIVSAAKEFNETTWAE
jgi:hypothetical protein